MTALPGAKVPAAEQPVVEPTGPAADLTAPHHRRRILATLFATQSFGAAAFAAMATAMPIVGAELTGRRAWAGVPFAVTLTAVGLASLAWGHLWDRLGRRRGLPLGLVCAALGGALAVQATRTGATPLFLASLLVIGLGQAAHGLSRFVAGEVVPKELRGGAIGTVVWGGTVGGVAGPLLLTPSSRLAATLGLQDLAGPFLIAIPLMLAATLIGFVGLHPEPLLISRALALKDRDQRSEATPVRPLRTLLLVPGVQVAIASVVLAHTAMVMTMGITAVHMREMHHSLGAISVTFAAHTAGMYAFSPLFGRLADRRGRTAAIATGAMLMAAGLALAPRVTGVIGLAPALLLLGLGWNGCFVGGSALLADQLSPDERSRTQGVNDLFIGLAAAGASFGGGLVFAGMGYGVMTALGLAAVLMGLAWGAWRYRRVVNGPVEPRPAPANP